MKRTFQSMLFTCLLLCISANTNAARIYKWVDASGQTHYTQKKPPSGTATSPVDKNAASVVAPRWSRAMKEKAREFMDKARVRRIWVDQNGKRVSGWY